MKSVMFLIFLNMIMGVRSAKLNEYLKNYEVSNVRISRPNVAFLQQESSATSEDSLRIRFTAYGQVFDLLVYKTNKKEIPSFTVSGEPTIPQKFRFYESDTSCTRCVRAMGYIAGSVFTGIVQSGNDTYYIEPSKKYVLNPATEANAIIYKDDDVNYPKIDEQYTHHGNLYKERKPFSTNLFDENIRELACKIEVVADTSLFDQMGRNTDDVIAYLYLHAKFSDNIIRQLNFGSGIIRLVVKNVVVYTNHKTRDYPFRQYTDDMYEFLNLYSNRLQEYCLSLCICSKIFGGDAIGVAYKADRYNLEAGGICELPTINLGIFKSLNAAVITNKNKRGDDLPLGITLNSFAHEIGHSFGSPHDPTNNLTCSPGGHQGYYLMHSVCQKAATPLVSVFSPCSVADMQEVVSRRHCFESIDAVCGNGIREGEEECDCGKKSTCEKVDPCCTPSEGAGGDAGCTFRRSQGYQCSPREAPCCTQNCGYARDQECSRDVKPCHFGRCDGMSMNCPTLQQSPDGSQCLGSSKTCSRGNCNSTVCKDNTLSDCTCDSAENKCFVCCLIDNRCVPASEINLISSGYKTFFHLYGTPCGSGNFQCNVDGECVKPPANPVKYETADTVNKWHIFIIIIFCSVIISLFILSIKFCLRRKRREQYYQQPSSNVYVIGSSRNRPPPGPYSVTPVFGSTIDVPVTRY